MATDPFTLFHSKIGDIFKASVPLQTLIANIKKNYIDFAEGRNDPRKTNIAESDLPEVVHIAVGSVPHLSFSSSGVEVRHQFRLEVNTGNFNIGDLYYPLEFAILGVMLQANFGQELRSLQWNGRRFVIDVGVSGIERGLSDSSNNRGISGWTGIWNIDSQMHFERADILAHYAGTIP